MKFEPYARAEPVWTSERQLKGYESIVNRFEPVLIPQLQSRKANAGVLLPLSLTKLVNFVLSIPLPIFIMLVSTQLHTKLDLSFKLGETGQQMQVSVSKEGLANEEPTQTRSATLLHASKGSKKLLATD